MRDENMQLEEEMTSVNTMTDPDTDSPSIAHSVRIASNQLVKQCQDAGIPMFFCFYLPEKGYQYAAIFPEEMPERDNLKSQNHKFKRFLQAVIDFDKKQYMTHISEMQSKFTEEDEE